jgi:hypothetical protein
MTAIAELVTHATVDAVTEAATPATKPVRKRPTRAKTTKTAEPVAAPEPTPAEIEFAFKSQWDSATTGEADAKTAMDRAKLAWENSRVVRCRVAFAVADYVGFKEDGSANLLAIARILGTEADLTPGERTKKAKSRKNSFRLYVAAGMALDADGLARRITEPDAEERAIVRDVFSAKTEDAKTDAPESEGAAGGDTEGEATGVDAVALGAVDILGHIARMQASFKLITESKVVISEREAGQIAEMLANFSLQLEEYSEGK